MQEDIFAKEDRGLYIEDFLLARTFAHQMFNYVLFKYQLLEDCETPTFNSAEGKYVPPFCEHIGEAIIVLSFVNRLKFKCIFDENKTLLESDFLYEKVVYDFVKNLYVEGHADQFLIICGFFIDLTIYFYLKFLKDRADSLTNFFGDMYRFVMRDIFLKRGGWMEVKRQAKPWWHSYRNYYIREAEFKLRNPGKVSPFAVDFHNPTIELNNDLYPFLMKLLGYPTTIVTAREYLPVRLDKSVPIPVPSRGSPVCEIDIYENPVVQTEPERQPANEPNAEGHDKEKDQRKLKSKRKKK